MDEYKEFIEFNYARLCFKKLHFPKTKIYVELDDYIRLLKSN